MSNADRARDTLDRIRQRRNQTDGARGAGNSQNEAESNTEEAGPDDGESPVKRAAARRREAREKLNKERAKRMESLNQNVDEYEGLNEGDEGKADILDKLLLKVERPDQIYPLQFSFKSVANERVTQPSLVVPDALDPLSVFRSGTTETTGGSELLQHYDAKKIPREWTFDGRFDRDQNSVGGAAAQEHERLLNGIEASGTADEELHYERHCGLYDGAELVTTPAALAMYLNGENVPTTSSGTPGPKNKVSRITQRLLRDLEMLSNEYKVMQELARVSERNENIQPPLGQAGPSGLANLLRDSEMGSIVKVIGDPANGILENVSVPGVTESVGGRVGNWSIDDDSNEILGPCILLDGNEQRGNLKTLRISVSQVMLRDHPLFIDEERLTTTLKEQHAQYSLLFEHRATLYLSYRLFAATKELKKLYALIRGNDEVDDFEDYHDKLMTTYDEIVQVLPALNDIRVAIDGMSLNVYNTWKELKSVRHKQGFTTTRLKLYARKVQQAKSGEGNNGMEDVADAPAYDENKSFTRLDDDAALWQMLTEELKGVPGLLEDVRGIIVATAAKKHQASTSDLGEGSGELSATLIARKQSSLQVKHINRIQEEQVKFERIMENAKEACAGLKHGIIPEVVFSIMESGELTADNDKSLSLMEAARRKALENLSVAVGLRVNGKFLARSKYHSLIAPEMTAELAHTFTLQVSEVPTLTMDVLLKANVGTIAGMASPTESLAHLHIPLPGYDRESLKMSNPTAAYGFVPVVEWLNFTSTNEMGTSESLWEHLQRYLPLEAPAPKNTNKLRVQGAVLVASEYVIRNDRDVGGKYPLSTDGINDKALSQMPLHSKRGNSDGNTDFAREKDFQLMLRGIDNATIDKNDPSNRAILLSRARARLQGTRAERDVFQLNPGPHLGEIFSEDGASYLNYFRFQEPMRNKLLRMRNSKPFLFTQPIPLSDKTIRRSDIYRSILATERQKMLEISGGGTEEDTDDEGDDDIGGIKAATRRAAESFWTRVRESQANMSRTKMKKTYATGGIVAETDHTPHLTWMEVLDFSWIIPPRKRALRPQPQQRAPHVVQVAGCNVLVQVVGARNLPVREDIENIGDTQATGATSLRSGADEGVSTFVEVRFQDHAVKTTTLGGSSPLWKQSLSLPFQAPQMDFTPAALMQVKDELVFSIFDSTEEDDADRGGYLEGEQTRRSEKRFLGSFSVPFSTIYTEGKVEGIFRVNTPKFNFGYMGGTITKDQGTLLAEAITGNPDLEAQRPPVIEERGLLETLGLPSLQDMGRAIVGDPTTLLGLRADPSSLDAMANNLLFSEDVEKELSAMASNKQATYIKIMATLDPLLVNHMTIDENATPSSLHKDDRPFSAYSRNWLKSLRNYAPYTANRAYQLFGSNSKGEGVLISRYLAPQEPPLGYESRRECIHFVSQIPFIADAHAFVGEKDVWCTSEEVFQLCAGDEEEHGVVLFNYLYYLSVQSGRSNQAISSQQKDSPEVFLVVGKAIPEGKTVYVAAKADPGNSASSEYIIINPCNGYVYSRFDSNCPLIEVAMLVTPTNLYANIQADARPRHTSFDVNNPYAWRPFFGKRCQVPHGGLQTIQPHVLYKETSQSYALEIEKSLTDGIKNAIRRWRSKRQNSTTIFHPDACNTMHSLLEDMDAFMLKGEFRGLRGEAALAGIQDRALQKLASALRMRKIRGFPVNLPFTDIEAILDTVRTMHIHDTTQRDAQFVVAVKIVPYVNNVFASWLYVGTMETATTGDIPQVNTAPTYGGNISPSRRSSIRDKRLPSFG